MKHLKKLSVVLMLTTLFSVTFTSCIDNEVSPLVEAIYEAQADLIAAQAGVQNAEATLLLAQANAENAQAELTASYAAENDAYTAGIIIRNAFEEARNEQRLLQLVAETNAAVAAAQNDLAKAQLQFEIDMAALTAQMQAAGAQLAVGYAYDYRDAMWVVNNLKDDKLEAQGNLALAELYLKAAVGNDPETTWALYLAGLNTKLTTEQAKVTAAEAAIVALNAAKANPTARETQIAGLKAQVKTLTDRKAELVALIALAEKDRLAAVAAKDAAVAFMVDPTGPYAVAKKLVTDWKGYYAADTATVNAKTKLVAEKTAIIANYDATKTTLKAAKTAAIGVIGWKYSSTSTDLADDFIPTDPASGLLKDLADVNAALGTYPNPAPVYGASPKTATAPAVLTAQQKLWNADLALLTFEADFASLTGTYNAAATALVTATNAYNMTDWTASTTAAATNLTTAQANLATDLAAYNTAKTAFEANPAGSVNVDGPVGAVTDLGQLGIKTDASLVTYMRVATWTETSLGSGQYVPATFTGTKYNLTDLALEVTAIKAAASPTVIDNDNQIILWQQDGTFTDAGGLNPGSATYLSGAEAANTVVTIANPTITKAYFINVESDDATTLNVTTFNNAANKLGVAVTAPFYTGTTTRNYTDSAPRNFAIVVAGTILDTTLGYYDSAVATTYQKLWNAEKFVSETAYLKANAAVLLADKQEDYDYYKGLFEAGLATRATLEANVAAAKAVIGKVAGGTPAAASGLLGDQQLLTWKLGSDDFLSKSLSDAKLTTSSAGAFYTVGGVKTLNAYAVLFNARKDFHALVSVTLAQHKLDLAAAQTALTTATREAAEDLIFIAKYTADLATLQAQYDALILTPLYAALEVAIVNATQAKAVLVAEDSAATASISSLGTLITALQTTVPDYTALIGAQNIKITDAKAAILATQIAISKGGVTLAGLQADVQMYKDEIAVLTIRIANAQAIADKYKALMLAALAS